MIMSVFVVISHITLVLLGGVDSCSSSSVYSNFRRRAGANKVDVALTVLGLAVLSSLGRETFLDKLGLLTVVRLGVVGCLGRVTVLDVLGWLTVAGTSGDVCVTTDDGTGTLTVLTFGNVDLGRGVVGSRAVDSVELSVVGPVLDVELGSDVALVGLLVAVAGCLTREFDLGALLGGKAALLLVDVDVLLELRWRELAGAFLLVDVDVFLELGRLGVLGGLADAVLLVDMDFFLVLLLSWLADAVFFVDAELLVLVLAVCWDGTREGFDASFVTFPSRSLR